jgi:hypothetical protein
MSFRLLSSVNGRFVFYLIILFAGAVARGQQVVLHLRNGDRVAGFVISENTNQMVLSNSWANGLVVPLAQIERWEFTPGTNATARLATTNYVLGTGLLAVMNGGKLPINTNTFWRRWKGEAAVGTDLERGAIEHQLYYGKATLTYTQPYASDPKEVFKNIFTYDAAYGKTDGTLSDNRMGGSSKTDFDVSRRIYLYNLGVAYYDELRKIDLHYEDGPGAGWHWFKLTNFAVNLELGANYQVEHRSDDTSVYSAYYRLGEDMTWKISKQATFTQKFEYFPRVGYAGQYRMRFESTLAYALLLHLSWNLSVVDFYDTQPAAGVPNNDLQFRTSLGVKF